jgi:hypothetical protein
MYISLRNSRSCSCFQASHIGQVAFASSITNPRLELRGSRFTSNYKSRLGLLCSAVLCFELSHKKFSVKMGVYTACCHAVFCRLSVCLSHVCLPTAVPGVDIMGHHRLPAYRAHINCTDNNSSHHSSLQLSNTVCCARSSRVRLAGKSNHMNIDTPPCKVHCMNMCYTHTIYLHTIHTHDVPYRENCWWNEITHHSRGTDTQYG